MEITISSIKSIVGGCLGHGNPAHLILDINLTDRQAEQLFYKLWEYNRDQTFKKWIEAEGDQLNKITIIK